MNSASYHKYKNRQKPKIKKNTKNNKKSSQKESKTNRRSNILYNEKFYKELYLNNIKKKSTENKELIKMLNNTAKIYSNIGPRLDDRTAKNLNDLGIKRFNEVNRRINDVEKLINEFDNEFTNYNINEKTRPKSSNFAKKTKKIINTKNNSIDELISLNQNIETKKNIKTDFFKEQSKIEKKFKKSKELLTLLNTLNYFEQKGLLTNGNNSYQKDNNLSFYRKKIDNIKQQEINTHKKYHNNINKEIFSSSVRNKSTKYNTSFFNINSPIYPEKSLSLVSVTTDKTKNKIKNRPKSSDCRYCFTNAQKEYGRSLFNTEKKYCYTTRMIGEFNNNNSKNCSNYSKFKRPASSYNRSNAMSKIHDCNIKINNLLDGIIEDGQKISKNLKLKFSNLKKENKNIKKNKNNRLHLNINKLRSEMDLQNNTKYKIDIKVLLSNNTKKLKKYLKKGDLKLAEQLSQTIINEDRLNNKPLEIDESFNNSLFRRRVRREINVDSYKTRVIKETLDRLKNKTIIDPQQQLNKLIEKNHVCLFNDYESLKKLVTKSRVLKKQIFFPQ